MGNPGIVNTWQPENATIADGYSFIVAGYNGKECLVFYRRMLPGQFYAPSPSDCERMF